MVVLDTMWKQHNFDRGAVNTAGKEYQVKDILVDISLVEAQYV